MSELQTLDGAPMTWAELNERNARWHSRHGAYSTLAVDEVIGGPIGSPARSPYAERPLPDVRCSRCAGGNCHVCDGTSGYLNRARCSCRCRRSAA